MNLCARKCSRREQGFVLLVLLLFVALLSISFLGMIQRFDFQIRRDREEELIHRGVQYSRAVRKFVKKFGRYPENIEELEGTSNFRFLRKRYKDPVTGKDFRLLHINELRGTLPIAPPASKPDAAQQSVPQLLNSNAAASNRLDPSAPADSQNVQGNVAGNNQNGVPQSDQGVSSGTATPASPQPASTSVSPNGAPTLGAGAVVGVASISKEKTIREFNHKNHYNDWQFVYDPTTDNLASINGPNQPLKAGVSPNLLPGNQAAPHGVGVGPGQVNPPAGPSGPAADQQ